MTCHHHYHWCQHQSSGCSLQESTRGYEGNKHGPRNYDWHRHHKPACVDIYMYTYTHTYTQMLERNVSNASRKDEGQWEYKEVHLLRGEEKQGNKTVMSSQESADGTHTYTSSERQKRICQADKAITSPFHSLFCPEASPFHLFSAPPTLVRQESH